MSQSQSAWPHVSLGDYTVFHDLLFSHGERVGDEGGTCPIVDLEEGLIHCTGTIRLSGVQITFQGLTTTAPTKHVAITGGTGRYQAVSGQATLVELGNGRGSSPSSCAARQGTQRPPPW